jgi:hypothetical protein
MHSAFGNYIRANLGDQSVSWKVSGLWRTAQCDAAFQERFSDHKRDLASQLNGELVVFDGFAC